MELKPKKQATVETPEMELLESAKRMYAARLFTIARENFEALRDGYPLGPYTEFAEIKIADCYFESHDYESAAKAYEEFVKEHPASPSLPYVMMRAGRSNQLAFKGIGRDTQPLQHAVEIYDHLIKTYPNTVYAESARTLKVECLELLSESEQFIADFYRRTGKEISADARESVVQLKWAPMIKIARAEMLAHLTSTPTQNPDEDEPDASELDTLGVTESYVAMIQQSEPEPTPVTHKNEGQPDEPPPALSQAKWRIDSFKCSQDGNKMAFITLNAPLTDEEFLEQYRKFTVQAAPFKLKIPDAAANPFGVDCFRAGDVKVMADGTIEMLLPIGTQGRTMLLTEPPRIALLFEN